MRSLLKFFSQTGVLIALIFKRQWFNRGLTFLSLASIILSIGLVTNASFFSRAVDKLILTQELKEFSRVTGRPAFSTAVYMLPSAENPVPLQKAEGLSQTIAGTLSRNVGLPLRQTGIEISSGTLMLQPVPDSRLYAEGKSYLGSVNAVYLAGIARHITVSEGDPYIEGGSSANVLNVWMSEKQSQKIGVQVGEVLQMGLNLVDRQQQVRIAGFWHAVDPLEEYWFTNPEGAYAESLLVRREDYINFIQPLLVAGSREVSWYIILDDSRMISTRGAAYLQGFKQGLVEINRAIPGASMNTPPLEPLESFVARSDTLTILLLGYDLPAFAILLYFLALASGIIAQWQRKETTMLVSRGMNVSGILKLILLEQAVLFAAGLPLGIGLGMGIAWVMGFSSTFLSFTTRAALPVSLDALNIPLLLLALGVSLISRVLACPAGRSPEHRHRRTRVGAALAWPGLVPLLSRPDPDRPHLLPVHLDGSPGLPGEPGDLDPG